MSGAVRLAALLLPLALAACADATDGSYQGYVEGTYVRVAAEDAGRLAEVAVSRGDHVAAGDLLFRLTADAQDATVRQAEAQVAEAQAALADLKAGSRPEEIAVVAAQRDAAQATLDTAQKEFNRLTALRQTNVVAQADLDAAEGRLESARAGLAEAERQLAVTQLPPRPDAVRSAEASIAAAEAALKAAEVARDRRSVAAPAAGLVEETYFETGESVAAAQPVVSILPDEGGRTVRFYVAEAALPRFRAGTQVTVSCDGCSAFAATVTFVADQAEFTPPVIYSRETEEKLVYRVEARPEGGAAPAVGQPVLVHPAGAGS
jgi:HlyD family secretion protein